MSNKKKSLKPAVLIYAANAICLALVLFLFLRASNENVKLRNTVGILQKRLDKLSVEAQQEFDRRKSEKESLREGSLAYLEWRYMLKNQVRLCDDKLSSQLNKIKGAKGNKELINLVYYNLGLNYMSGADFDAAIQAFEAAIRYSDKDSYSHYNLGLLYSLNRKNYGRAVLNYKRFLELVPRGPDSEQAKQRLESLKK